MRRTVLPGSSRLTSTLLISTLLISGPSAVRAQPLATAAEVGSFWNTVFRGAAPYGVPTLATARSNERTVGGATVWDVTFDSYRDPDTNAPVRIFGYFAIPTGVGPGPGGTFPGIVSTHSQGGCPTCGDPTEGIDTAVFYAERGYAALAFYLRGYAPSTMSNPALNVTAGSNAFCENMTGAGAEPLDTLWAGYAVDLFQAGEVVAAQPEVWVANGLALIGHSLGGYAAAIGGIFSDRYTVIAASAPPMTGSDPVGWAAIANPISSCADRLPGPAAMNRALVARLVSFVGVHQAINEPSLYAIDPSWRLDGVEIFFYGGEVDPVVPALGVEQSYLLADASNNAAFHWSPTGGHGGTESWYRSRAWLDGHFPGIPASPPTAALSIASISGLTVTFDASASTDDDTMIAWDYDFGDGVRRNTGDTVVYSYPSAGTYTVTVTVTDGEGTRDSASVTLSVGGVAAPELMVRAAGPLVVPEAGSATFTVTLTASPSAPVSVSIARESGDADLTAGSATLSFDATNWSVAQSVTISAADDADASSDAAVFALTAAGIPTVRVDAVEADDDGSFGVSVASAFTRPGESVDVAVTLSNLDDARIRSLSVTLGFDGDVLGDPSITRGSVVPDPSLWTFGATSPSLGVQVIAGSEVAQPEGLAIAGVLAIDTFTIAAGAAPGVYPIMVTMTDIDGRPAGMMTAGGVTVLAPGEVPPDAGAPDSGVPPDGTIPGDGGVDRVPVSGGCGCRIGGGPPGADLFWLALAIFALGRGKRRRPAR